LTRITNADQVLLLLRAHLERTARQRRKDAPAAAKVEARQGPLERVHGMAGADNLSERALSRALVSGLLTEEFGVDVANEPRFQEIVDGVLRIIDADEASRALLQKALTELGEPG
jgi:hypothetical protein